MITPAVVVVSISPEELRSLVREAIRTELDARAALPAAASPLATKSEVAAELGVSPATVDRLSRDGRLPFVRVGDSRRYDRSAVRAALDVTVSTRRPTTPPTREKIAGVRLLSRGRQ